MQNPKPETRNSKLVLPALPDGSADALVEHLYVEAGEQIARGQALALVRTERYAYDIPASASGTLAGLLVAPGDRTAVGATLATLEADADAAAPPQVTQGAPARLRATPLARRVALAHAVELQQLTPGGRGPLRRADVLRFLQAATAPAPAQAAPTALTAIEIDWSAVDGYLKQQARRRKAIDRRACLASAAAAALVHHRLLLGRWSEEGVHLTRSCDLRLGDRLVRDAADKSPAGIARAMEQSPDGDAGATAFVIAADSPALWRDALLPDGAAALLCVGQARSEPRVVDPGDRVAARPISLVALVYDVRVLDQRQADAFLADLRARLERIGGLC